MRRSNFRGKSISFKKVLSVLSNNPKYTMGIEYPGNNAEFIGIKNVLKKLNKLKCPALFRKKLNLSPRLLRIGVHLGAFK